MKCFDQDNPRAGLEMAHNGRCFRGIPAPEVHAQATHHVRSGSLCMHTCGECAREFERRKDKDTEVTPL